jgi:hypothetical protein
MPSRNRTNLKKSVEQSKQNHVRDEDCGLVGKAITEPVVTSLSNCDGNMNVTVSKKKALELSSSSSQSSKQCLKQMTKHCSIINVMNANEMDTCIYASCPVPNCYKQFFIKDTPSLQGECIPLLPDGTIDLNAPCPRRCRNLIQAIRIHFDKWHNTEDLPLAAKRKRLRQYDEMRVGM